MAKFVAKFRSGNFDVSDAPRSGRPHTIEMSKVKAIVDQNPAQYAREIVIVQDVSLTTIGNHLQRLGFWEIIGTK